MRVWIDNDKAVVGCQYHEKELVKAVGDYRFDKKTKTWKFPIRRITRIIDLLNIEANEETREVYKQFKESERVLIEKVNFGSLIKTNGFIGSSEEKKFIKDFNVDRIDLSVVKIHQRKAIYLGILFGSYALFMETGTGKTLCAIQLAEYWGVPAMIMSPLQTLEAVWVREIEKWSKLTKVILWENIKEIHKQYDMYILNYEHFKKISKKYPELIEKRVQAIIVDESSKLKHHDTSITQTVLEYTEKVPHRLCLTGTPAPNNLLEYWGQMAFINPEILSGHTKSGFYKFRNTYFVSTGYEGYQFVPGPGSKEAIIKKISEQAFSVRKADCLDLPERVYEERIVYMDKVQEAAYDEMFKENVLEFEGHTSIGVNQLAKIMKLRQITSGFIIDVRGMPILISRNTVDALIALLEEIPEDEKVVVWCQFHWEIEHLKHEFGDKAVTLYGGMTVKEKKEALYLFEEDKDIRIMLAHPITGGKGLNWQNICSHMIWFCLSYSQEDWSQANDRIYRDGQDNKCTYYILIAEKPNQETKKKAQTIDRVIYKVLQDKSDLSNECMEMLK